MALGFISLLLCVKMVSVNGVQTEEAILPDFERGYPNKSMIEWSTCYFMLAFHDFFQMPSLLFIFSS